MSHIYVLSGLTENLPVLSCLYVPFFLVPCSSVHCVPRKLIYAGKKPNICTFVRHTNTSINTKMFHSEHCESLSFKKPHVLKPRRGGIPNPPSLKDTIFNRNTPKWHVKHLKMTNPIGGFSRLLLLCKNPLQSLSPFPVLWNIWPLLAAEALPILNNT